MKCYKEQKFKSLYYTEILRIWKEMIKRYYFLALWRWISYATFVEAESIAHKYYNSSTKPKFYKNIRLIGKIIEKISLTNFY